MWTEIHEKRIISTVVLSILLCIMVWYTAFRIMPVNAVNNFEEAQAQEMVEECTAEESNPQHDHEEVINAVTERSHGFLLGFVIMFYVFIAVAAGVCMFYCFRNRRSHSKAIVVVNLCEGFAFACVIIAIIIKIIIMQK